MDVHMNSQTKLQKYQSTKLQMLTPTDTNTNTFTLGNLIFQRYRYQY